MKKTLVSVKRCKKKETFLVPEGEYRGKVTNVETVDKGDDYEISVRFQLDWKSPEGETGAARLCIRSRNIDSLLKILDQWLGSEVVDELSKDELFDLQNLVGKNADLFIREIDPRPPYTETLRVIEEIQSPGTLLPLVKSLCEDKTGEFEI
jgi:hypothetical protein